ncbi:3-oxoacyl-ACP synthase [Shewanella sairae]|uniref:3-oxoacyl-ACP synthase n=1 Tax=Shewanella sairae TaxID=190310 RepID=A0ABQ4PQC3_9GAMM|nr:ketoacyl-ACP synthase III [Shewanella sairae]MCL1129264.1 ketoacyl-ACP synthase III [Shewanella sairae]GIU50288.1 3-oxoacyl-ACP synthase [Shewanella sairae]
MIYLKAISNYIPSQVIDNIENAKAFSESESFIINKIGARQLPRLPYDEQASDIGSAAVRALCDQHGLNFEEIEALVVITQNGDFGGLPHTSAIIHGKLGLPEQVACFDIGLGCSGYVYGLSILKAHMQEMGFQNAVLVTADPYSKIVDSNDRNTSLLFGDAATASWLSVNGEWEIQRPLLATNGQGYSALVKQESLVMDGRSVFNFAAQNVPDQINNYLEKFNLVHDDIDLFLLHQGSAAIIDVITRKLNYSKDKFIFDIENTGNTVSSSIPLLCERYIKESRFNKIVISGFGVGLSWATTLLSKKVSI